MERTSAAQIRWVAALGLKAVLVVAIATVIAMAWDPLIAPLFRSANERQLSKELDAALSNADKSQIISLSTIHSLRDFDELCIVDAYAIDIGTRQEASLNRIFGGRDFSQFRDEIVHRYTDDFYPVGFYLVKGRVVVRSLRVYMGKHAYLTPAKISDSSGPRYFTMSACYRPADLCLQKLPEDSFRQQPVGVQFCTPALN